MKYTIMGFSQEFLLQLGYDELQTNGKIKRIKLDYTDVGLLRYFVDSYSDLEKITVKAITSRARINKSTFYRNYADKYDLFYSIISNLLREYKATLSPDFFELVSIGSIAAIEKAINPIIDFLFPWVPWTTNQIAQSNNSLNDKKCKTY